MRPLLLAIPGPRKRVVADGTRRDPGCRAPLTTGKLRRMPGSVALMALRRTMPRWIMRLSPEIPRSAKCAAPSTTGTMIAAVVPIDALPTVPPEMAAAHRRKRGRGSPSPELGPWRGHLSIGAHMVMTVHEMDVADMRGIVRASPPTAVGPRRRSLASVIHTVAKGRPVPPPLIPLIF